MKARVYNADQNFIIECTAIYKHDEEMVYLRTGTNLEKELSDCYLHYTDDNQGVLDLRCRYAGYEREGMQYIITLEVTEVLKSVQRRMDIKVKTNIPVRLVLLDFDDKIRTDPQTQKAVQVLAYLRDISAGGIMIESETLLEIGQKLMFPFDKGSSPILVNAQVIREQPPSGSFHCYGCRFLDNNSGKESVIREYVFRLQLASRNMARSPEDI